MEETVSQNEKDLNYSFYYILMKNNRECGNLFLLFT